MEIILEIIREIINACSAEVARIILLALAGALGTVVAKLLNTETKRRVAKIAAQFAEQVYKDLHGDDKLQKALEAAAALLKKRGLKFDAAEMRILIEAAVGEFNEVFAKSWPILEGIAVEDLDDDQLRSLLQQCGFTYTENMTREEMLAALDEDKDAEAGMLT